MNKRFFLNLASLEKIYEYIADFVGSENLDKDLHYQIDLVIEELFSNMVKYDHKKKGMVDLKLEKKGNDLIIVITDYDVHRFDLTKVKDYDISSDLDRRPPGKLGIHLVKKLVDHIDYLYKDNNSIITLTKHIGSTHV